MEILTVCVVTMPFAFEGSRRMSQAEEGLRNLEEILDSTIAVPNEGILELAGCRTTLLDLFRMADDTLRQAVAGISNLITIPSLIDVWFEDMRTVIRKMHIAGMGVGVGRSGNRAMEAVQRAISSPLLGRRAIENATGVILNVSGGPDVKLHEATEAAKIIEKAVGVDVPIVFGLVFMPERAGTLVATIIAGR